MAAPPAWTEPLVCAECGKTADAEADGWKTFLSGGYEGETIVAVTFCPTCAECEFRRP